MEPRLREWGSGWSLGSEGVGKWVEPGLRGSGEVGGVWVQREWGSGGACPMQPLLWRPNTLCWLRGKSLGLVCIYWSGWSLEIEQLDTAAVASNGDKLVLLLLLVPVCR